ncbi:MAG TPA: hydantoinase/oxoprolinase family protein [Solirubrobacterales bacterium]|nr:hydantoinase/oxoprolinase family protein [Solirubrobacterales bacterium]
MSQSLDQPAVAQLAIDIGGTFSDLIAYDQSTGEVTVAKGSSTPAVPEQGVLAVVARALPDQRLADVSLFVHGATVALNALLERRGATVGMITTAGFRDVLELRRGDRVVHDSVLWSPAEPLVPRELRFEVRERVLADGTVDVELSRDEVEAVAAALIEAEVGAIAIAFINSYVSPDHELMAEAILRESGFEGEVSLSSSVSGEMREYERTSTTAIDAYVKPRVGGYLSRLSSGLAERGFRGECLMTSCGGGAVSFGEATARPFETIMSGPVGGAVGAGSLCRALGIEMGVCADVGGTSFDTCLILDGRPEFKYEGAIDDMPLQTRWVDVRSIGAGGGSLAYIDEGELLRVGPQSAGADPGPACYGRGGMTPTVTDAAALLGMLARGELADGLALDVEAAGRAIAPLAARLGLGADETAQGIMRIATANMANAIREITLEQGRDPRDAALIAYGGAGPLFAILLALELEIGEVVVPVHAGNFSAWGLLAQDISRSRARTVVAALDEDGLEGAGEALAAIFAELDEPGRDDGREAVREAALDLRYQGQEYTLNVPVRLGAVGIESAVEEVARDFAESYGRVYGHTLQTPLEIVAARGTLRTPLPEVAPAAPAPDASPSPPSTVQAHSFVAGERLPFRVLERASLAPGSRTEGPAIVLEPTTTTYVDAGFEIRVEEGGAMVLRDASGTDGDA